MIDDATKGSPAEACAVRTGLMLLLTLALALPSATGCRKAGSEYSVGAGPPAARPTEPGSQRLASNVADEAKEEAEAPAEAPGSGPAPEKRPASAERMIVYHAWLRLAVHAIEETLARIDALAERLGGYVESSTLEQRVLRIPVASYQTAVDELKGLGEVREFRESSWDITEKYQNIEARIDNLRALRARYLVLLSLAQTMEDRLAIERELRRIELELRVLEEEQRFLADQAAFATITVNVEPIATETSLKGRKPQPFGWVESYGPGTLF